VPGTWVCKGNWKLIRLYCNNDDQADRFELYNLKDDLSETNTSPPGCPLK
jgi:formate dehydrogenase maturation protein FdhE